MINKAEQNQDRVRFGETVETPVVRAADVVPGVKKKLPYAAPRIEVIEVSIERGFAASPSDLDQVDW